MPESAPSPSYNLCDCLRVRMAARLQLLWPPALPPLAGPSRPAPRTGSSARSAALPGRTHFLPAQPHETLPKRLRASIPRTKTCLWGQRADTPRTNPPRRTQRLRASAHGTKQPRLRRELAASGPMTAPAEALGGGLTPRPPAAAQLQSLVLLAPSPDQAVRRGYSHRAADTDPQATRAGWNSGLSLAVTLPAPAASIVRAAVSAPVIFSGLERLAWLAARQPRKRPVLEAAPLPAE